jgi:large subunit ribosomal protein L4e
VKLKVLSLAKEAKSEINAPEQMNEPVRPDLIKKAVLAVQNNTRQAYGSTPLAGKKVSAFVSKRRRDYKACYGHGIARTPRKIMSKRGMRMNWVGAFAPNTVGGRRSHPPKLFKIWDWKINTKERRKAIRSAMSACIIKTMVVERGHKVPENYPFFIETKFEDISKTKDALIALEKLGFAEELERLGDVRIRAGRGKMRGRKYRIKKGPLIVVSQKCKLMDAAANIRGIDVVTVDRLNAELLAPGCDFGRLALFTEAAVKRLETEKLFTENIVVAKK